MILYCVFGVEYHVCSELIGTYDSKEKAEIKLVNMESGFFDKVEVREIELNTDLE